MGKWLHQNSVIYNEICRVDGDTGGQRSVGSGKCPAHGDQSAPACAASKGQWSQYECDRTALGLLNEKTPPKRSLDGAPFIWHPFAAHR